MQKTIIRRQQVDDHHLPAFLHPIIKQIYARRGVAHADELQLTAKQLIPVEKMQGISKACALLTDAFLLLLWEILTLMARPAPH